MEEKLEVGQVLESNIGNNKYEILYIGNDVYFCRDMKNGFELTIDKELYRYYMKKPEPKLTKLVAWVNSSAIGDVIVSSEKDQDTILQNRKPKQIIVKDGQLFVEDN